MQKLLLAALFSLLVVSIQAQTVPAKYRVQLSDKDNTPFSIDRPEEFLSQKAIDRRNDQGISIKWNDLPVDPAYIQQLKTAGAQVLNKSKWFNSVTITLDTALADDVEALPFVESMLLIRELEAKTSDKFEEVGPLESTGFSNADYGDAFNQIQMLNGHILHSLGFTGKGVTIAIMDSGFKDADDIEAFQEAFLEGRVLGTHDFVDLETDVFDDGTHGTSVWSCIGAKQPGVMVGTASDANFYLLRSEDVSSEYLIEEDNWVAAAEFADSAGADVFNTSLGYSTFDDASMNHTYDDMDGNTTRIAVGADIAASKGIVVVNSAGNEGNSPWRYITSAADGDSVLAVGAVNASGALASFSSRGPSADGDVKPNVCAQGAGTTVLNTLGVAGTSNGTSFSGPIIAGMAACLVQAFPEKSAWEIHKAIEMSAPNYETPDNDCGYGIPDFAKAHSILAKNSTALPPASGTPLVYPNPVSDVVNVLLYDNSQSEYTIRIFNSVGQCMYESLVDMPPATYITLLINVLEQAPTGIYILRVDGPDESTDIKLLKQ